MPGFSKEAGHLNPRNSLLLFARLDPNSRSELQSIPFTASINHHYRQQFGPRDFPRSRNHNPKRSIDLRQFRGKHGYEDEYDLCNVE